MRIGLSTAIFFNRYMIEDIPAVLDDWGVRFAEYFLNSFCEYEPDFIALLAQRSRKHGITVTSIHPMSSMFETQLFSLHPRQRDDAFRIFEKVLSAGKALGSHRYCMHGSTHLTGAVKNQEISRIAPIYDELVSMAREFDIQLTLENVSWCFCREPEYAIRLLEAMHRDDLHFTLDVKQALRSNVDPLSFVEAIGERIDAVHCCDCKMENGVPTYLLPPYGGYDFAMLIDRLKQKGFDGDVLIEVYSDTYGETTELRDAFYAFRDMLSDQ